MNPLLILVGAYLAGSVPFGLLVARIFKGIDIREHGSKNIGATNVWRVLGWKCGSFCLVLDVLKGALPVLLPLMLLAADDPNRTHWQVAAGLLAIIGHMFPIWLGFHGGKGVATALGVVMMLAYLSTAITFGVFVACFAATRIISISSIVAALTFAISQMIMLRPQPFNGEHWSLAAFSLAVPAMIIVKHRSNIGRLLRGEEPRFEFRKKLPASDDAKSTPADEVGRDPNDASRK
jgi:glycerol-3-phosphate acyltransferase PlsY